MDSSVRHNGPPDVCFVVTYVFVMRHDVLCFLALCSVVLSCVAFRCAVLRCALLCDVEKQLPTVLFASLFHRAVVRSVEQIPKPHVNTRSAIFAVGIRQQSMRKRSKQTLTKLSLGEARKPGT